MENSVKSRELFFENIIPCGGGYSIINGEKVHIDSLTETEAVGTTEAGDWFAAKKDFGMLRFDLTTARADWKIAEEENLLPIEGRAAAFLKNHSPEKLFTVEHFSSWFRRLTGACMSGRNEFIQSNGFDLNDLCNAKFFLDYVCDNGVANDALKALRTQYKDCESVYQKTEDAK